MKDYYKILLIDYTATKQQIVEAYNTNIQQFNNLPFLTEDMKSKIKDLKEAKYVLLDDDRRNQYNILLNQNNIEIEQNNQQEIEKINEPQPEQYNRFLNHPIIPKIEDERQFNNTQICDRIFNTFR